MTIDDELKLVYDRADWNLIPDHMVEGVKNWVEYGWFPGSFLTKMLEHDIYDAVWCADNVNEGSIANWVKFLEWYMPSQCHGNEERVRDWHARGGLRGVDNLDETIPVYPHP